MAADSLATLNKIHQTFNTYITYSVSEGNSSVEVHTFYRRIFDMVGSNDFSGTNLKYQSDSPRSKFSEDGFVALSLLELCQLHKKTVPVSLVYDRNFKEA